VPRSGRLEFGLPRPYRRSKLFTRPANHGLVASVWSAPAAPIDFARARATSLTRFFCTRPAPVFQSPPSWSLFSPSTFLHLCPRGLVPPQPSLHLASPACQSPIAFPIHHLLPSWRATFFFFPIIVTLLARLFHTPLPVPTPPSLHLTSLAPPWSRSPCHGVIVCVNDLRYWSITPACRIPHFTSPTSSRNYCPCLGSQLLACRSHKLNPSGWPGIVRPVFSPPSHLALLFHNGRLGQSAIRLPDLTPITFRSY
jgi:hypothetical protein